VLAAWAGLASVLAAPADACRLALILAIDVSSSVDAAEDRMQRDGVASALIDPDVQAAFFASPDPVAVMVYAWSGRYQQTVLHDWSIVQSPQDLQQMAQSVANAPRLHDDFPTAMGYALGFASTQFARGPACLTRTIDIAGDGINNEGFTPDLAYNAFAFDGVTVNGLVVKTGDDGLVSYFHDNVIHGSGAFVEVADGYSDYAPAMRRKLLRELTAMIVGVAPLSGNSKG